MPKKSKEQTDLTKLHTELAKLREQSRICEDTVNDLLGKMGKCVKQRSQYSREKKL